MTLTTKAEQQLHQVNMFIEFNHLVWLFTIICRLYLYVVLIGGNKFNSIEYCRPDFCDKNFCIAVYSK